MQNRNRPLHPKTQFPRVTRIEIERPLQRFAERLVRVAKHYDIRAFPSEPRLKRVIQVVRIHNMMEQEFATVQLNHLSLSITETGVVSVARDRRDRRYTLQRQQYFWKPYITCVQDTVDTFQQVRQFQVEEIVCV